MVELANAGYAILPLVNEHVVVAIGVVKRTGVELTNFVSEVLGIVILALEALLVTMAIDTLQADFGYDVMDVGVFWADYVYIVMVLVAALVVLVHVSMDVVASINEI